MRGKIIVQLPLIKGAVLHEPETAIEMIYFPLTGMASLLAVTKEGETVEVASVGRDKACPTAVVLRLTMMSATA